MRWDFSIRQRAEDRWAEARTAADEQRRLRHLEAAEPKDRDSRGTQAGLPYVGWSVRFRRWLEGMAGIIALLMALATQAGAQTVADVARTLAENVLGPGTVRTIRFVEEHQRLDIRWEAATYRAGLSVPDARYQLYGEAELATGAILARLQDVTAVRFTIVRGARMLATGENQSGHEITMIFAPELGGGSVTRGPSSSPQTVTTSSRTGRRAGRTLW